nr:3-hydroxyacyl-CoA dehydrogenase family protein [uncultured Sphaerochaeta sp.]
MVRDIKVITVLGANGTVGSQVVKLLVTNLDVEVFLLCRTKEKALQAIDSIKIKAKENSIIGTMIPADFSTLADCVSHSDWIFESVSEDLAIKLRIFKQIIPFLNPNTLVSTGTSSFLIEQLVKPFNVGFRKQFYGTHFFNPPDKLLLLEFISTEWNDSEVSLKFENYLRKHLMRKCVRTKDVHGFLANRIGSIFLNDVALLAEECSDKGGVEYIDYIVGRFTGRSMAPLMTIDYIGVDVFMKILDNVRKDCPKYFQSNKSPQFLDTLLKEGKHGRKTGSGLYRLNILPNGSKEKYVFDLKSKRYCSIKNYQYTFIARMIDLQIQGDLVASFQVLMGSNEDEAMLCKYLLLRYITISYLAVKEAVFEEKDVDTAMEYGYSWISPRKLVFLLGGSKGLRLLRDSNKRIRHTIEDIDIEELGAFQVPIQESDLRFFTYIKKSN